MPKILKKVEVNGQEFHDDESEDGPSLKVTVQDGDLTRVFEFNETGVTETDFINGEFNRALVTRPYRDLVADRMSDDDWDDDECDYDPFDGYDWDDDDCDWDDECDCTGCKASLARQRHTAVDPINPNNDEPMLF